MIPFTAVADAIAGRIAGRWPERTVYRDVCPADMERPSFFLSCGSVSVEPVMGLLSLQGEFQLEIFDEKDAFYVTSSERLMAVQAEVLGLFSSCDLPVEDRRLAVEARAEGREPDEAFVAFTVTWMDAGDEEVPKLPLMEEFEFAAEARG